jgi:hypothetical protein
MVIIKAKFAGGFYSKVDVVAGLISLPDVDNDYKWDLEIIVDENNQDILIGSSFFIFNLRDFSS